MSASVHICWSTWAKCLYLPSVIAAHIQDALTVSKFVFFPVIKETRIAGVTKKEQSLHFFHSVLVSHRWLGFISLNQFESWLQRLRENQTTFSSSAAELQPSVTLWNLVHMRTTVKPSARGLQTCNLVRTVRKDDSSFHSLQHRPVPSKCWCKLLYFSSSLKVCSKVCVFKGHNNAKRLS